MRLSKPQRFPQKQFKINPIVLKKSWFKSCVEFESVVRINKYRLRGVLGEQRRFIPKNSNVLFFFHVFCSIFFNNQPMELKPSRTFLFLCLKLSPGSDCSIFLFFDLFFCWLIISGRKHQFRLIFVVLACWFRAQAKNKSYSREKQKLGKSRWTDVTILIPHV